MSRPPTSTSCAARWAPSFILTTDDARRNPPIARISLQEKADASSANRPRRRPPPRGALEGLIKSRTRNPLLARQPLAQRRRALDQRRHRRVELQAVVLQAAILQGRVHANEEHGREGARDRGRLDGRQASAGGGRHHPLAILGAGGEHAPAGIKPAPANPAHALLPQPPRAP